MEKEEGETSSSKVEKKSNHRGMRRKEMEIMIVWSFYKIIVSFR